MKDVVVESLRFLVREKRAVVYGFVIMPNHIHLVWHIPEPHTLTEVKAALLSYTAHRFKKVLQARDPSELEQYRVDLKDRAYQFWKRDTLSVAIYHDAVFWQKMEYLHWSPCTERWKLAAEPKLYRYSSAYTPEGKLHWDFVSLW
jgi:putative transposase